MSRSKFNPKKFEDSDWLLFFREISFSELKDSVLVPSRENFSGLSHKTRVLKVFFHRQKSYLEFTKFLFTPKPSEGVSN